MNPIFGLLLAACVLAVLPVPGRAETVRTADGLGLSLNTAGAVIGLAVDGTALPLSSAPGGFLLTEFSPGGARREWGAVRGKTSARGEGRELRAALAEARLEFSAEFRARKDYIDVEGEIADRSGADRALLVTFRLPLQTTGGRWWDDIERQRLVAAGKSYDNDARLGERGDISVARLPFSALTLARSGLSLATPTHEPRVFRFWVDPEGYHVSFALGLAPSVGKEKARARFRFVLYRHDPAWGLRSAAQRFYDLFPELYVKRVKGEGSWGFDFEDGAVAHLEDFGAVFCGVGKVTFTEEETVYIRDQGLYAFKHREPWAWWHRVRIAEARYQQGPSRLAEPGDPPAPPLEEELAIIAAKTREPAEVLDGNDQIPGPVREVAAAAQHCFLYDEQDRPRRLLWHLWRTKEGYAWHSQIPLNPNPHLPSPNRADLARKYQFQNMAAWNDPKVRHVNGVSFDSLTEWTGFPIEDYRHDNFRYATIPLTFQPRNGRIVQIKGFEDWELTKVWSDEIRGKGRFLMANTDTQPMLFCGHLLDFAGIERSADAVSEEEMALVRTLCFQKPAGYYRPLTEKGMRKCLFYGIHPGGLQVLERRERAEAARPLFKKYAPLIQTLAQAGWQPITRARVPADSGVKIERFGTEYFTLRNPGDSPKEVEVTIEDGLTAREILQKRAVTVREQDGALNVTVSLAADETLVLQVTPRTEKGNSR